MPWRERSPVDLRVQFIGEYQTDLWSMTELAAQYGISRKTAYKWVDAVRARRRGGVAAIGRVGRMTQPSATDPGAGGRRCWRSGGVIRGGGPRSCWRSDAGSDARAAWPSRSTVCDLLRRHGLVVPRPRRRPMPHGGPRAGAHHRAQRRRGRPTSRANSARETGAIAIR